MFILKQSDHLKGTINVAGSKNAGLPLVAANTLIDNQITLHNLPDIIDIKNIITIASRAKQHSSDFYNLTTPLCEKIRASILLIPVGLHHFGKVHFYGTGGCKIGKRSLDTFDDAFAQAGVDVTYEDAKIYTQVRLPQSEIILNEFSVTTTEALLTYLAFHPGITQAIKIRQAAIEPHVLNVMDFLNTAGAKIMLDVEHTFTIHPSKIHIREKDFTVIGDYLEAGLYMGIAATTPDSEITITGCPVVNYTAMLPVFKTIGVHYEILDHQTIKVNSSNLSNYQPANIHTMIHPGLCTDLQSIFGVLFTQCQGQSKIFETMFEGRFGYLTEIQNLGADINILNPHQVLINGPTPLKGGYIASTDLRGGGAALMCGIIASGTTFITNEAMILRGYDRILEKLQSLGVHIEHKE